MNVEEQNFDESAGSDHQNANNDDEFDDYGTEVVHDNLNLGASLQPPMSQGLNVNPLSND